VHNKRQTTQGSNTRNIFLQNECYQSPFQQKAAQKSSLSPFQQKAAQKSSLKKIVIIRFFFVKEAILPKSISTERHSRKTTMHGSTK
jgi:hypothetical protein